MHRKVRCKFAPLVILSIWSLDAAATHDGELDDILTTPVHGYEVRYTAANPRNCGLEMPLPGDDLNFMSNYKALQMARAIDSGDAGMPGAPADYHSGYVDLGFNAPDFSDTVYIYDCGYGSVHDDPDDDQGHCDNGSAGLDIRIPSTNYCNEPEIKIRWVMGHELFHMVQRSYGVSSVVLGRMPYEGTARMIEDHIYTDIDDWVDSVFLAEVRNYMNNPNRSLWAGNGYHSALAWKYAAERFGTITTEPERGVDFIRRFWELVEANKDNPDVPATLASTIDEFSPGTGLQQWFLDFAIANLAREFDVSAVPNSSRYRYIDETGDVVYRSVARQDLGSIPGTVSTVLDVADWGASYYEVEIGSSCVPGFFVGYNSNGSTTQTVMAVNPLGEINALIVGGGSEVAATFVQRAGDDRFDRLFVILSGESNGYLPGSTGFNGVLDCGFGSLDLRLPSTQYKSYVGPEDDPRRLLVRMQVTGPESLGGDVVRGLRAEEFIVYVGNFGVPDDLATIVSGTYNQGQYWLTVIPPDKPDQSTYDLHVSMTGLGPFLSSSQTAAVSYETRIYDQVIVIDSSESMGEPVSSPRMTAAKSAASVFVDLAAPGDQIGVVRFSGDNVEPSDDAFVEETLGAASDAKRVAAKTAIAAITPAGGTSIGDGLVTAASQIATLGGADGEDWIILLSDGVENEAEFWNDIENDIKAAGIRVNTIAVGSGADEVLLQEIALETGGIPAMLDDDDVERAQGGGGGLGNRLADAFASAFEAMRGWQRLWKIEGVLSPGQTGNYSIPVAGDGIADARFMWHWADPATSIDVEILRPDGTTVADGVAGASVYTGATHIVFHIGALGAGDWTVNVTAASGSPDYIGILSGDDRQGAELTLMLGQDSDDPLVEQVGGQFLRGLPQPIRAQLTDKNGLIDDADVIARVTHPSDSVIELPLFDDGMHADGNADDGVYGNVYTRTTVASAPDDPVSGIFGGYDVRIEATGTDNFGNAFTRLRNMSFQTVEPGDLSPGIDADGDDDGMPDRYEDLHDCLDKTVADGLADADEDNSPSLAEWFQGLAPCTPDTDGGGETDLSELGRSANPFDPRDDVMSAPIDVEVVDYLYEHLDAPAPSDLRPNANLIRYQVNPVYHQIRLLRSTNADGPFSQVATFAAQANGGLYYDLGLTNGVTYHYRIQPEDVNGNLAVPSRVFAGTPRLDPVPPLGSVEINGGDLVTTSTLVDLALDAQDDVVDMLVSNDSAFAAGAWLPYQPLLPWTIQPDPTAGVAMVYVKYRDAAGNESNEYHASIRWRDPGEVGTLRGEVTLLGQGDHANITVETMGPGGVVDFTSVAGIYTLSPVEPGLYDVEFSFPLYLTAVVENVSAVAGQTTFLRDVVLTPIDTDGDGVADLTDNCTAAANPSQIDGDADGFGNACDADLNNDCVVNALDLGAFKLVFLSVDPVADLNGDGAVNATDLGVFKSLFLVPPGPSASGDCVPAP